MNTADHLVEAEKILQKMIEKNPVLQQLIDDLALVLVSATPIACDDETLPDGRRAEAAGGRETTWARP